MSRSSIAQYPSLGGRPVFITGGGTGIGAAEIGGLQVLVNKVARNDRHSIARMVMFLAPDESRMCTAQEFVVDAGWT